MTRSPPASSLFFDHLLLPSGWARDVRLTVSDGVIATIEADSRPAAQDERHGCGLPGMPNLHSHAFQRGIAGLTEQRGSEADNFWSWRERMYRFVGRMTPADMQAIAALAYLEMLEGGFTRVGEFHYLHHNPDGRHYEDVAEMGSALVAAAEESGIGLTLLPVLYCHAGFGAQPPQDRQARFITSPDDYARLIEGTDRHVSRLPDGIVGVAPHSLRAVSPTDLGAIAPLMAGRPVHIHIAEQLKEVEDCIAWSGQRPVEWLLDHANVDSSWCLVHATHMTETESIAMVRSGAIAGLCPVTEANLGDGFFPARTFTAAGGRYGIGSDSNVLIDCSEELRLLEYGQRLVHRGRNIMAWEAGRSTGAALYCAALDGGAAALGVDSGLSAGAPADMVSLDLDHPALACRSGDALIDSFLFAAGRSAVDCVWRRGEKLVSGGRHRARERVTKRYRAALERLIR